MYTKLHDQLFAFLDKQPRQVLFGASLAIVALLGTVDALTGDYSFILFYLIPVFLAAWFVGKRCGLLVCLCSGLASFLANPGRFHFPYVVRPAFPYWDFTLEMGYLLLLSLMFTTLKRKMEHEKRMARTDPLTEALNRRSLYGLAEFEIEMCRRYGRPISIAYLDLDNFKEINDRFGHAVGDDVLVEVVRTVHLHFRRSDVVARLGGDEFVVLFPETDASAAPQVMRKLNESLLAAMAAKGWPITFSVGLLTYNTPPSSVEEMVGRVDNLMYEVKARGKGGILHVLQG